MRYLILLCLLFGLTAFAQQQSDLDVLKIEAIIDPVVLDSKIEGTIRVSFQVRQSVDSVFLDAKNMTIKSQALESVSVKATADKILLYNSFQPNQTYTAFFTYEAEPRQALYFGNGQLWTQGQGKYTSHWLPSVDDMNDKIEFDLSVWAEKDETVIANGHLVSIKEQDGRNLWKFDMDHSMSSYLVALAVGRYNKQEFQTQSNIPIQLYYEPKDSLKVEPTYRYTKEIFEFLERDIGIPYPWTNYKEVPIRDFLYAGMENTTATFFSEAFMVDSIGFIDRNYVNINAHELAHQWFGNLVTETEGTHHWLHEGFATYYALLSEQEIFGTDYYYWKLYNSAEQLKSLSDQGKGERLTNPKASSLTFYEKGAWALHRLKELIGVPAFQEGIKNYLNKYAFQNVTTENFIAEMSNVTNIDLSSWRANWLEQSAFPAEEAYESLMKSPFMQEYFAIASLRSVALLEKKTALEVAIESNNDFIGQEAVYQLAKEPFTEVEPLYQLALQGGNTMIRQAVALSLQTVPESFRASYESLLKDPSYLTQEAALFSLWSSFPSERRRYLDPLKNTTGFQNKNIRQLYLALALYTDGYVTPEKAKFSEELQSYTYPKYSFEIREKAFEMLYNMGLMTDQVLQNLVNACTHHYWRFRDAARNMLDDYVLDEGHRKRVLGVVESLNDQEKSYLKRKYGW